MRGGAEEIRKLSAVIAGALVEIRTRHILNTSVDPIVRSRVFVVEGSEAVPLWLMGMYVDFVTELDSDNGHRKLKISG
jgi:hypothetical protein